MQHFQMKWDKIIEISEDFNSVLCHTRSSSGWHTHIMVNFRCSHFNLNFPFLVRNTYCAGFFGLKKLDRSHRRNVGCSAVFCSVLNNWTPFQRKSNPKPSLCKASYHVPTYWCNSLANPCPGAFAPDPHGSGDMHRTLQAIWVSLN